MAHDGLRVRRVVLMAAWIGVSATVGAQCGVNWSKQFEATVFPGSAYAMVAHDDGSGPALYIAPALSTTATTVNVWRYRGPGLPMETVGGAFDGSVRALAVYDDGTGPALYAAGDFLFVGGVHINHIAKWNGSTWSILYAGLDANVWTLAVYDDGTGPALFAGGSFANAGLVPAAGIARWKAGTWTGNPAIAGSSSSVYVRSLAVFNPGTGNRLYIAGSFTSMAGVPAARIVSFDGSGLAPLGTGFTGTYDSIEDLQVYDPGTGPRLYASGSFSSAGGVAASNIARWDGASWSALGAGNDASVHSLCVWNLPTGPRLVAGGDFSTAGGLVTGGVALFDGTAWSSVNAVGRTAQVVGTFSIGGVEQLYTVGLIGPPPNPGGGGGSSGNTALYQLFQRCSGVAWSLPTGHGLAGGAVSLLEIHDDGSGPQLYAGGGYSSAGGNYVPGLARWNGLAWSPVGGGGPVNALKSFNDGTGPALYSFSQGVLNSFSQGVVQKWNGATWTQVGLTFDWPANCFAVYDPGTGPRLYVGGNFTTIGGVTVNHVAQWNGAAWVPLGSGVAGGQVNAMAVFDDGSGPKLYAAGDFTAAGGAPATGIATWNGTNWSALGAGITSGGAVVSTLKALAVYNDGTGPALYVGGSFHTWVGASCVNLAKWNGSIWSFPATVGNLLPWSTETVNAMCAFDDTTGPKLYMTGSFTQVGASPANGIARWNGSTFETLAPGLGAAAVGVASGLALGAYDAGLGASVFVGGNFTTAGGSPSGLIAEIVPARPMLTIAQTGGPGSGVTILDSMLNVGLTTFDVFSLEPAPNGPGTGPYVGLYASNFATLLAQVNLPLGTTPFHFTASTATAMFGPYVAIVPPGTVIEGLIFQVGGCFSTVAHYVIQ